MLDAQTSQPIPYASVAVLGTSQGTTCNAEGEFALKMSALPGRLVFSQLSYRRDTVAVAAAGTLPVVRLLPAPVQLPDVKVENYVATLLTRAYEQLQRTRAQTNYGQAFYRQTTRNNGKPTELLEAVWDVTTTSAGVSGVRLAQGRYAKVPGAFMNFSNFSEITRMASAICGLDAADTTARRPVVRPGAGRFYQLRLVGVTESNGRSVAEIDFVSLPGNDRPVTGSVFIALDNYQVLRARARRPLQLSQVESKGGMVEEYTTQVEVDFKPAGAGLSSRLIQASSVLRMKPRRQAVKTMETSSFAYFYDEMLRPTGLPYLSPDKPSRDLADIRQKPYDLAFWRDNPVVKRTPLEEEIVRSFESEKAFGTMLSPKQK